MRVFELSPTVKKALNKEKGSIDEAIRQLEERRTKIEELLGDSPRPAKVPAAYVVKPVGSMTTVHMARVVIRNAGRPLPPDTVAEKIRTTFGVAPAKTLHEMLLKRTRSGGSGFYKTSEGHIGLTEMMPQVETVAIIEGSAAPA